MPAPSPPPGQMIGNWLRARVHLLLTKAPRERPDLLVIVCILAVAVLGAYALAYLLGA